MRDATKIDRLRKVINENLRVQLGGPETIEYVDVSGALSDVTARQNHVIFGRRGCGKTLLLHEATKRVEASIRVVYVNCEDYKQHSFPNVLIEILDRLFAELEHHLFGWFGRRKRLRELIHEIRQRLLALKSDPDERAVAVKQSVEASSSDQVSASLSASVASVGVGATETNKVAIEQEYKSLDSKIQKLNLELPKLKERLRSFFLESTNVKSVFLELDDFYHLPREMQPYVADYVHRLCKDLPISFKIATLRHATTLYADRSGQPIGAQERHDYQPIDIDFTLADFRRTAEQVRKILYGFGEQAGWSVDEIDDLFRGEGFERLVLASGGVPRDFLSLLLEAISKGEGEPRIGKDAVRTMSRGIWQRRIEELKADSQQKDQESLLRGIYAIQRFCLDKKNNVFLVADQVLREPNGVRELLSRLMDYRIIHAVGSALTHKTVRGTFNAYMIDIGAYANLRKLEDRFSEIDVTAADSKERMRVAPALDEATLRSLFTSAPRNAEELVVKAGGDEESP